MVTMYTGRETAVRTAKHHAAVLAPLVADPTLKTATLAEVNAGHAIQCSIKEIGITGSPNNESEQYICDEDATETAGATTWSITPLVLDAGNPQEANELVDNLVKGSILYVIERRGPVHDVEFAADALVSIAKIEVSHVEWVEVTANTAGEKFRVRIHASVRKYERVATIVEG